MQKDMTQGNITRHLVRYAVPLIVTAILQQLYTVCDSFIVGRYLGSNAFAAIGSCAYLNGIPQSILRGFAQGVGVSLAQRFGAKDGKGLGEHFATGCALALGLSLVFTGAGLPLLQPLLSLMDTPAELMNDSAAYLTVLWGGSVLMTLLNIATTSLCSLGDSRTPFISMMVSFAVNIALDILFVAVFEWGVKGAAWATLISEAVAAVYCVMMLKRTNCLSPRLPTREATKEILRLSVPPMLSEGANALSGGLYQRTVNGFGVDAVTGLAASARLFDMLDLVGYGMEGATGTFTGQNAGAGDGERIRRGVRKSFVIGAAATVVTNAIVILFARQLVSLFIVGENAASAIAIGATSLRVAAITIVVMFALCNYRAAVQGMGNSLIPMISGFAELGIKTAAIIVLPRLFGLEGLYFINTAAWIPVAGFLYIAYRVIWNKKYRTEGIK